MDILQLENLYKSATLENSSELISAVRAAHSSRGISSLTLISTLNKFLDSYLPEGLQACSKGSAMTEDQEKRLILHGKITAALMLVLLSTRSYNKLSDKMLLFLFFSAHITKSELDLASAAILCQSRGCTHLGYTWDHVKEEETLELITYLIVDRAKFDGRDFAPVNYSGRGYISLDNGKLKVASSLVGDNGASAFSTCGGAIETVTRNIRDEKLKASDQNDAVRLEQFADSFIRTQEDSGRLSASGQKDSLKVGDKVVIRCEGFVYDDEGQPSLSAVAIDSKELPEGIIIDEELYKGIYTEDIINYICDSDCIVDAVVTSVGSRVEFSIMEAYSRYSRRTADEDYKKSTLFEAKAVAVIEDINRINWITARGYGAISYMLDGIKEGDTAVLEVANVQPKGDELYINVVPPGYEYDTVQYRFDDDQVLAEFVTDAKTALAAVNPARKSEDDTKKDTLQMLSRIISLVPQGTDSLNRYKRLLTAQFISYCLGNNDEAALARQQAVYLNRLLCFAQGSIVRSAPDSAALTAEQALVIQCLSLFSNPEKVKSIASVLASCDDGGVCRQVAELVMAEGISDQFEDEVKVDKDSVRKRICELLGVSDQFRSSDSVTMGKYGLSEGHHLEFKSSYVMRNDGKGPDLDYQGRGQVFEAVCGFLNSEGGTLYLGVNDRTGDPIISEEYGLKGDIKWFCENFSTVKTIRYNQLGRYVAKPDSLDHYVLFLNSEKYLFFKKDVADSITIEVTEDEDAIRFTVPSYKYEIVYLYDDETHTKGNAYTRDGNRTIIMSRTAMERRLMELKDIRKDVSFIVTLQQAIDQKRKVIFRGYHSGNSGEVRDRYVVPINLFYNDENVLCYDLDAHMEKQFRLARITSIDTDIPDSEYPHSFQPKNADVFRWINDDSYHIKVKMEVGARNYLMEEYSNAKNLPEDEFYPTDDGKWILDTRLQGLGAMRRFFLGLADKIEILPTEDSDRLIEDISNFVNENLSGFFKKG